MTRANKDRVMTYWTAALLGLALAASPATARTKAPTVVEGQTPQPPIEAGNYPYQLFVPKGYLADSATPYPLLIFLHGSGAALAFLLFLCILAVTLVQLKLAKRGGAI